jgi:DNA polymerase III subunit gamma/tau
MPMDDSTDMFGSDPAEEEAEAPPSAAELEAAGQAAMFGEPAPAKPASAPAAPATTAQPYRVLARKYRPQTFSQLIGQEAMVQTLANAIKRERLAHAFLMTGVRGVGKTSTARLIAKALNCVGPDGNGGPTIDPCGVCEPCVAIAEGRHIDVIEMDAASHTGVDDVREIIEAVRYSAVSARYKIYIIDEVHMLSRNAFNALLKTLEEPPPHVKFLFATTEADKLPVTVLSRCQRFDLRRIPTPMLADHFAGICKAELVEAESEALAMIAAAAEGSVRDGLSILDQAIAHAELGEGEGRVTAGQVRDMLGLADRSVQRRLFAALLAGDGAALLELVAQQFALGVEPLSLLRSVLELTHRVTVAQLGQKDAAAVSAEEREAIEGWAGSLAPGQLHRLWQLLLKGFEEVRTAPDPLVAAQMALLRVMHAADLPDPGALIKKLEDLASRPAPAASADAGTPAAPSAPAAKAAPQWDALVQQVDASGQLRISQIMHDWLRPVSLAPGALRFAIVPGYSGDPVPEVRDALLRATGERWIVERVDEGGAPSLRETEESRRADEQAALLRSPLVEATFAAFPNAEFVADEGDDRKWSQRA